MTNASLSEARALLKSTFGYDDFRPGQDEVIAAVLAGEDVFAIMPTGSGKSMCYQLPALVGGGLTLVVSPLIALMRDQVAQLRTAGVAAASLNSMNSEAEGEEAWRQLGAGALRLLFVSPERLALDGLVARLARADVRRIAIDEAHCVSQWGHDFRPEYRDLRRAAEAIGVRQTVALTATADRTTRTDVVSRLFGAEPRLFVHSFDRPNLTLRFAPKENPRRQIEAFLAGHRDESGIVYCGSRERTERFAGHFTAAGFPAVAYHAGLDRDIRNRNGDRFLQEDGIVAFATIAFGMGINKPDVRFVVHADMPGSIEAYYQEIGRAGRDGLPADTLTLYGLDDMALHRRRIEEKGFEEPRRRAEHRRFDALAALCEASVCRRQTLLAYFDEPSTPCGRCDLCEGGVSLRDGTVEAQKVLSAVVRTGQRFGATYLIGLLRGEATDAMRRNGHDALKTFGVGRDLAKRTWGSVIRQLFAAQAIETVSEEHGGFQITERGESILRGREPIALRSDAFDAPKSRQNRAPERPAQPADAATASLLAELKRTRLDMARAEGLPAFMIFPDRTLVDMAERRPWTLAEMRRVQGIGDIKLKRYGEAFLQTIRRASG